MQSIETYLPVTQAKAHLLDTVRQLQETDEVIAITKNGVPQAILLSMSKFDSLLETIDILADRTTMEQIRQSGKEIQEGKLLDLDEAW